MHKRVERGIRSELIQFLKDLPLSPKISLKLPPIISERRSSERMKREKKRGRKSNKDGNSANILPWITIPNIKRNFHSAFNACRCKPLSLLPATLARPYLLTLSTCFHRTPAKVTYVVNLLGTSPAVALCHVFREIPTAFPQSRYERICFALCRTLSSRWRSRSWRARIKRDRRDAVSVERKSDPIVHPKSVLLP